MNHSLKVVFLFFMLFSYKTLFAQKLYEMPQGIESHVSSLENPNGLKGDGGKSNAGAKGSAYTSLKVGESKTLLHINSAGVIQRIWVTINDYGVAEMLRALRIQMYWDGSDQPAVDVPFGDFFCNALGKTIPFQSALYSNPEGRSFNCYIPMPFKTGAKVVLTNTGSKDLDLLFFDIDFVTVEKPEEDLLYFHAVWSRQQNPVGQDVVLLPEVKGKGRFLGVSAGLNVNPVYANTWWGEGEVKMYIDGDKTNPTINGTGSEDYIGTGWMEGVFANQYQGCLVANAANRQYAFYRFHIPDAIYFYKDFKATLQQIGGYYARDVEELRAKGVPLQPVSVNGKGLLDGGFTGKVNDDDWMNFYRSDDYAVTAYYYLDRP